MKPVSQLYNLYPGSDIFIVGSGPSMRVFPQEYLEDKITIGLNMAWKNLPVKYGITVHPDLNVPEFIKGEEPHPEITWVTKRDKSRSLLSPKHFAYADKNFYTFDDKGQPDTSKKGDPSNHGRITEWVRQASGDNLYLWSSISQTAMNLAANMGAKNIILVGCDNCSLKDNHHAHLQHTRWKSVEPEYRYSQYYEGMAEVRQALFLRGVNVLSLTPFLGLNNAPADFERLCHDLEKDAYIPSHDLGEEVAGKTSRATTLLRKIFNR